MGFCSGTDIFDPVAEFVIEADINEQLKVDLLKKLIDALEDHDWDCQGDSMFYDNVYVERAMRELHPDWFEDEDAE